MAFTTSFLTKTTFGNQRVHFIRVTADAATGVVDTGFDVVEMFSVGNQSSTAATEKYAMNELCAGTASVGNIGITGCTSGDEYMLTVYGR